MIRDDSIDLERRRLIRLSAGLAAAPLFGCGALDHNLGSACPADPAMSYSAAPLTIDAHCHVFNATDLQVKEFISRVASHQTGALGDLARAFGGMLQDLGWALAPDGDRELSALRGIVAQLAKCDYRALVETLNGLRQEGYTIGREQLKRALERSPEMASALAMSPSVTASTLQVQRARAAIEIQRLPDTADEYEEMKARRSIAVTAAPQRTALGMIDFVLQNFQYRYASAHTYLQTYNQPGKRVVDLVVAMMVDYDWWLAKGRQTPTTLAKQVEVMERIAVLTRGRIHAFVPYCPLRQVAKHLGESNDNGLQLVKDAIEQRGCIGVKLYPPMGFAPMGSATKDGTRFWAQTWLPAWTARPDLGTMLDDAMRALFDWAQAEQVPIMAHTSLSNGPSDAFQTLAGIEYWTRALGEFPRLRVSFGHFGDTSPVKDGLDRARAFCDLMSANPNTPGVNAFADAGYFVEVLDREPRLRDVLRTLYDETAPKGQAALAYRFMYGTDWEMTLVEGAVNSYLSEFVSLMDEMETRPALQSRSISQLSERFFGENAVDWLGLRRGRPARMRIENFYTRNGVRTPDWVSKVDRVV